MSIKLPWTVSALLLVIGSLLLALSTYMEVAHLALLQQHPIYANLLSGAVGFCFGILALSLVLGRIVERSQHALQVSILKGYILQLESDGRRLIKMLGPARSPEVTDRLLRNLPTAHRDHVSASNFRSAAAAWLEDVEAHVTILSPRADAESDLKESITLARRTLDQIPVTDSAQAVNFAMWQLVKVMSRYLYLVM